jgi:hypothetical protein
VNARELCPSCAGTSFRVFYEQHGVPSHSVLMLPTREAALGFPRGDLRLAFCRDCGFVWNVEFDPSLNAYSAQYEESQAFSPRFREFAEQLARRWIDTYDINGKTVLEIGCGKASFLGTMCELGDNRGIGVDPAAVRERIERGRDRIEVIADLYSERYADLPADVVLCRHTLEHIQPVHDFLSTVRAAIGDRTETIVLFELPDLRRVLDDLAFWDLYYEHCSYFTVGSLARLFRRTGFEVLALDVEYDGQYLTIEARPSSTPAPGGPRAGEDDVGELAAAVAQFEDRISTRLAAWRAQVDDTTAGGTRVVVWGGGSKGVTYVNTLGLGDEISCVVDINPYMQGCFVAGTGHEIVAPARLRAVEPDVVLLMNGIYQDEVRDELDRLDVRAEVVPV